MEHKYYTGEQILEALSEVGVGAGDTSEVLSYLGGLPSAEPKPHEINYTDCANAMLKMWIDNVLTDREYNHIMDKLNTYWAERRTDE